MYCEGAYIPLPDGALLCVMRDNLHHNYPSQVLSPSTTARRWTAARGGAVRRRPAVHRAARGRAPAGDLPQPGRQPGHLRLAGDVASRARATASRRCTRGRRRSRSPAEDGLRIRHPRRRRRSTTCSPRRATAVRCSSRRRCGWRAPAGAPRTGRCGLRAAGARRTSRLAAWHAERPLPGRLRTHRRRLMDRHWPADMTRWHTCGCTTRGGLVRVYLDGQDVLRFRLPAARRRSCPPASGSRADGTGTSCWRPSATSPATRASRSTAGSGTRAAGVFPDQYELDRLLELHANTHERPDNGYSTWLPLDGRRDPGPGLHQPGRPAGAVPHRGLPAAGGRLPDDGPAPLTRRLRRTECGQALPRR